MARAIMTRHSLMPRRAAPCAGALSVRAAQCPRSGERPGARRKGKSALERRGAPQIAAQAQVVAAAAVESGAVVPHDVVAGAPGVAVDEFRLGGVFEQLSDEEPAFRDAHAA